MFVFTVVVEGVNSPFKGKAGEGTRLRSLTSPHFHCAPPPLFMLAVVRFRAHRRPTIGSSSSALSHASPIMVASKGEWTKLKVSAATLEE